MSNLTIFETDHFVASQARDYKVPGYVIVQCKTPCEYVADLTPEQATDLFQSLARAEALVRDLLQPERIYNLKFGEALPTVHFHIFPRTREIGDAYAKFSGDQHPYSGARLMDWIWFHHDSLGYTEKQIQDFVDQARSLAQ